MKRKQHASDESQEPRKRQHIGTDPKGPRFGPILHTPWFTQSLPQAEELFGLRIFQHVLSSPVINTDPSHHHSYLQLVCKWFYDVLWKFTTDLSVTGRTIQRSLETCKRHQPDFKYLNSLTLLALPENNDNDNDNNNDNNDNDNKDNTHNSLIEYILPLSQLTRISLGHLTFDWSLLCRLLAGLPSLKVLYLGEITLVGTFTPEIFRTAIPTLTNLSKFAFTNSSGTLNDEGTEFDELFETLSVCTKLTKLCIDLVGTATGTQVKFFQDHVTNLVTLKTLQIGEMSALMDDSNLENFGKLTELEKLNFAVEAEDFSKNGTEFLTTLQKLRNFSCRLDFPSRAPPSLLSPLSNLPLLSAMQLTGHIKPPSLSSIGLCDLVQLRELRLGTNCCGVDVKELTKLSNLTCLTFEEGEGCPNLDSEFVSTISEMTQLEELELTSLSCNLDTMEYRSLNKLTNLKQLVIESFSLLDFGTHVPSDLSGEYGTHSATDGIFPLVSKLETLEIREPCLGDRILLLKRMFPSVNLIVEEGDAEMGFLMAFGDSESGSGSGSESEGEGEGFGSEGSGQSEEGSQE